MNGKEQIISSDTVKEHFERICTYGDWSDMESSNGEE